MSGQRTENPFFLPQYLGTIISCWFPVPVSSQRNTISRDLHSHQKEIISTLVVAIENEVLSGHVRYGGGMGVVFMQFDEQILLFVYMLSRTVGMYFFNLPLCLAHFFSRSMIMIMKILKGSFGENFYIENCPF